MKRIVIAYLFSVLSLTSYASEEALNETLVRVINQINAIMPLLDEAQDEIEPNARIQLHIESFEGADGLKHFGVRNDGTKEWIRDRLGIESSKIHEVPDPGLFVPHEDHDYPELHSVRKNILIAFNGEDAPYRFATGFERAILGLGQHFVNPARLERFVARFGSYKKERHRIILGMAAALERIARNMDVQFVLVPHYLDDYGMIQEFIEVLQERIAHQIVVSTGLVSVPHTAYFYGRYAKADLAISMRVHSMSPSIGLGIPVIPLTSQGRMRNFLSKIGLSDIGIDVKQEAFADLLAARALEMLADPVTYTEHTKKIIMKVREESRVCNQDIFRILSST